MKRIIAFVLMLVLVFSFSVSSFAQTADGQSTTLQSGWGSGTSNSTPSGYTSSWFTRVLYWLKELETSSNSMVTSLGNIFGEVVGVNADVSIIRTRTESIYSFVSDIKIDVNGIESHLDLINYAVDEIYLNSIAIKLAVDQLEGYVDGLEGYVDGLEGYVDGLESAFSTANSRLLNIMDDIFLIQQVHADEDDLALKEDSKPMEEVFTDTFFNSESDLSLNVDDLGILTSYIREFKSSYNFRENIGNPTPLSVINTYSDFNNWFSSSTGQAMDPTFTSSGDGGLNSPGEIVTEAPTFDYDFANETVTAVGNGVVKLYLYGAEVSNPYHLQITGNEQWWSFKATAQEEGKIISPVVYYEVYRSATQPELDNLLTKGYEFPYFGDPNHILDGDGYLEGYYFSTNADPSNLSYEYIADSEFNCTGFIEFDREKPIYFKSDHDISGYHRVVFCDSALSYIRLAPYQIIHFSDDVYTFKSIPTNSSINYFCFPEESADGITSDVIIYQEDTASSSTYSLRSSPSSQPDEFVPSFYEQRQNELLSILGVSK